VVSKPDTHDAIPVTSLYMPRTPTGPSQLWKPATSHKRFRTSLAHGDIYCGDALAYFHELRTGTADLIFLDPPFNLGKVYSNSRRRLDQQPKAQYQLWMSLVLQEAIRVLAPGGTLYLYHIPEWAIRFADLLDRQLTFQHWIAVSMKNGFARGRRLYPAHYALLMFSKGRPRRLRRPKLRPARCRHCGEHVKSYGGYTSIVERKGLNLSDLWDDTSPVRHGSRKHRAANELPPLIFERIFEISGRPNGLYVDPFSGSGGGAVRAAQVGMRFSCCDLLLANCRLTAKRLSELGKDQ